MKIKDKKCSEIDRGHAYKFLFSKNHNYNNIYVEGGES